MNEIRKHKIIDSLRLRGIGLEIGPLCWPVLTKKEATIHYVDHASTEELKALYKNDPGIKQDEIVHVDYALQGKSLRQTIPKNEQFDYVIASHVIEHVPDMIAWLKDVSSILKPGGHLSLAIPDKRFTFDIDRNVSSPAEVIGAYVDELQKPSAAMIVDYMSNYRSKVDAQQAWAGQLYISEDAGPHRYSLKDALKYARINKDTDDYVDTHCFVYTPASFFVVLRALIELSLCDFRVETFHDTAEGEYEFFVTLKKVSTKSKNAQLASLPAFPKNTPTRELQKMLEDRDERLLALQQKIDAILNSRSWKITRPLRNSLQRLRNLMS